MQVPKVPVWMVTFGSMDGPATRIAFAARMNELCDEWNLPAGRGRQAALGKRFKVTAKAARKWLTGAGYPEMSMALQIAEEAGVNINWLLQGAGPKRGEKVRAEQLVVTDGIESLPRTERDQVLDFIRWKFEQAGQWFTAERQARYLDAATALKGSATTGAAALAAPGKAQSMPGAAPQSTDSKAAGETPKRGSQPDKNAA